MKSLQKLAFVSLLLCSAFTAKSQVLISLLLGDKLNTDQIEFGLIGGVNRSFMNDIEGSKGLNNVGLGFYFHILLKGNSYLSTGVWGKSNVGASGMPTYAIGDSAFDEIYKDGELTKKIGYFYVPIMYHHRFNNRWYLEGGFQLGLRNSAKDIFKLEDFDGELSYTRRVKDEYKYLDAGLLVGAGYKLKKQLKSLAVGVNYYYGLVNVSEVPDLTIKNSSVYFYIKIPIGVGKAEATTTDE